MLSTQSGNQKVAGVTAEEADLLRRSTKKTKRGARERDEETVQMEEDGVATQMQESQNINEERTGQIGRPIKRTTLREREETTENHTVVRGFEMGNRVEKAVITDEGRTTEVFQFQAGTGDHHQDPPDDDKDHDTGGTGDPMTDVVYDEGQTSAGLEVVKQ
nr:uncharacterized protein LOC109158743 [Ipomoea batatas]